MRVTLATCILWIAVAWSSACSDEASSEARPGSNAGLDGGAESTSSACVALTEPPPWLDGFLEERNAKLTGAVEINPGVSLVDRATPTRRLQARESLADQLRALGLVTAIEEYATGGNVVGRLPAVGADAGEWVLVGGHYDSAARTPGANDNASGVVAVLAIAKMLATQPCRNRGVMFVMFDEEEVGLVGSTAFASKHADLGTSIVAVHTIDQVGWDADDDGVFEIERPTPTLFAEYQAVASTIGAKVAKTSTEGTDHQPLRARGFPAAGVTEEYVNGDTSPHRHQPGDTAPTIDRAYQALAVRLVAYVVSNELSGK